MNGTDKATKQAALAVVMSIILMRYMEEGREPDVEKAQKEAVDTLGTVYKFLDKDERSLTEMLSDL